MKKIKHDELRKLDKNARGWQTQREHSVIYASLAVTVASAIIIILNVL